MVFWWSEFRVVSLSEVVAFESIFLKWAMALKWRKLTFYTIFISTKRFNIGSHGGPLDDFERVTKRVKCIQECESTNQSLTLLIHCIMLLIYITKYDVAKNMLK